MSLSKLIKVLEEHQSKGGYNEELTVGLLLKLCKEAELIPEEPNLKITINENFSDNQSMLSWMRDWVKQYFNDQFKSSSKAVEETLNDIKEPELVEPVSLILDEPELPKESTEEIPEKKKRSKKDSSNDTK